MMNITAEEIANLINGKVIGNKSEKINGFSPIENGEKGHLSFIANEKFKCFLDSTESSVLIVSENLLQDKDYTPTIIVVEEAYQAFQILMNLYQKMMAKKTGISYQNIINYYLLDCVKEERQLELTFSK